MATLGTRVEDLIGTIADGVAVDSALTDSAQEILNILPDECLWLVIDESADISTNGYTVDTCKVMAVTRDGEFCKIMPLAYENRVINVPESLFAPSTNVPIYILKENKIYVYPTGFTGFKVQKVNYPTIIETDTNIGKIEKTGVTVSTAAVFTKTSHGLSVGDSVTLESWTKDVGGGAFPELEGLTTQVATVPLTSTFTLEGVTEASEAATGSFVSGTMFPKELEHIVVLGAAMKGRIHQLQLKRASIPSPPSAIPLSSIPSLTSIDVTVASSLSSSYTEPSLPVAPGSAAFTYTSPTLALESAPAITDLDLSNITVPSPPTVSISYSSATNSDASNSDASTQAVGPTAVGSVSVVADASYGSLPTAPIYIMPSVTTNFADAETYISSNEDIELANANISKNTSILQEYQLDIATNLNKFNADTAGYQADIKKLDREFEDAMKQNITDSQNEVSRIIKQAEIDSAKAQQDARQSVEIDLRNKAQDQVLNIHNKSQDQILNITNAAKEVEAEVEVARHKVQLHQSETQKYQQKIASAVQQYQVNKIQKEIALWQGEQTHKIQKFTAEITSAQAAYRESVDEYAASNSKYSAEVQSYGAQIQNNIQTYKVALDTFANELQVLSTTNQGIIAHNNSVIQHWQSEQSLDVTNYQAQVAEYQAEVERYQGEHGMMIQEMQPIQQQYQAALQGFMAKYTPTPGVQGNA